MSQEQEAQKNNILDSPIHKQLDSVDFNSPNSR